MFRAHLDLIQSSIHYCGVRVAHCWRDVAADSSSVFAKSKDGFPWRILCLMQVWSKDIEAFYILLLPTAVLMGELTVGSALTVLWKLSRSTDSGILAQHHKCAMIRSRQEHDPYPSTTDFVVPSQEGYIERQRLASTPWFQSLREGDMEAAG
jgi:hypothetical protein